MTSDAAMGQQQAIRAQPLAERQAAQLPPGAVAAVTTGQEVLPTEYVDGVRGIAATYVMLNHARFLLFISAATALAASPSTVFKAVLAVLALTRYGVAAVMCFFIVSGYAIHYRQAFKLAGTWQKMAWSDYAKHRFRRLYPPLLAAVALTFVFDLVGTHLYPGLYNGTSTVLSLGGDHTPTIASLLGTLTFLQGFVTKVFGSNDPLWSLAYEAFFYLVYPIVLGLDQRIGPVKMFALFIVLGLSVAAIIGMGITPDGLHVDLYSPTGIASHALNLLAMWPAWVAGVFIADARAGRVRIPTRWWSLGAVAGLLVLAASALYLVLKNPNIEINNINIFYLIWVVGFFGPIGWLCAGRHAQRTRAVVANLFKPLKRLGAMSYSLYIVHFPTLAVICAIWLAGHGSLPRTPWLMVGGIIAALAVGYGVHIVAERPFMGKRNLRRVEEQVRAESGLLPAVALAGVGMTPAVNLQVNPGGAPPVPYSTTDILNEVSRVAQEWVGQRWQLGNRVEDVRELPPGEVSHMAAFLGTVPDRAWMVQVRLAGTDGAAGQVTALVALRQGVIRAVEPPPR